LDNHLVSQTNPQDGNLGVQFPDQFE
jgi:hypothetical protein